MGESDKRRFLRRPFDDALFCYHDGTRLNAVPSDISLGGMFLDTDQYDSVSKGDLLGVVFDRHSGFPDAVYLFGRVMRTQTRPPMGIGVRWEKAVTTGPPKQLASFLEQLFDVKAEIFVKKVTEGTGRMRSMFRFDELQQALERRREEKALATKGQETIVAGTRVKLPPPKMSLKDPEAGPIGVATTQREVEELKVEVVSTNKPSLLPSRPMSAAMDDLELDLGPDDAGPARSSGPKAKPKGESKADKRARGSITSEVAAADVRAPAGVQAVMRVDELRVPVRVTDLGVSALFLNTPLAPVDPEADVFVEFQVSTRDGDLPVTLTCGVSDVRNTDKIKGIELVIRKVDEGGRKGILKRYVRWLHYNALAGD